MTIHIPSWLIWTTLFVLWLYGTWGTLILWAVEGRDRDRMLIVTILHAAMWPVMAVWYLISRLFRRPSDAD